jgi:hypothetical protein
VSDRPAPQFLAALYAKQSHCTTANRRYAVSTRAKKKSGGCFELALPLAETQRFRFADLACATLRAWSDCSSECDRGELGEEQISLNSVEEWQQSRFGLLPPCALTGRLGLPFR